MTYSVFSGMLNLT